MAKRTADIFYYIPKIHYLRPVFRITNPVIPTECSHHGGQNDTGAIQN